MPEISRVDSGADLEAVRHLCRAFREGQFERYGHENERVQRGYNETDFEKILARLPVLHAPPAGGILLARVAGEPAGCVMFARIDDTTCEMKRMFVSASHRGLGVARAMGEALLAAATQSGYRRMRLDTGPCQPEAVALYESLGFTPCEPYVEDGPLWPDKVYMEISL